MRKQLTPETVRFPEPLNLYSECCCEHHSILHWPPRPLNPVSMPFVSYKRTISRHTTHVRRDAPVRKISIVYTDFRCQTTGGSDYRTRLCIVWYGERQNAEKTVRTQCSFRLLVLAQFKRCGHEIPDPDCLPSRFYRTV